MKSNPFLRLPSAALAVAALVTHTQAAIPITIANPSFELGADGSSSHGPNNYQFGVFGWGGGPDTGTLSYRPPTTTDGSWVAFEGNFTGGTYLFQDVPNVPLAASYTFSIDLGVYWTGGTGTNNGTVTVGLEKTGVLVNTMVVPVGALSETAAQTWSVTLVNNGSIAAGDTLRVYVDKAGGNREYLVTLDSASLQAINRDMNWTNGAANMIWSTTDDNWSFGPGWDYPTDNAVFGATGVGTVNLADETIGVNNITFDVAGYTIASNTLTLNNSTITANANATISSALAGSGLIKAGSSTLELSGANSYTGATTVNSGTLLLSGASSSSSSINVNATGTLALSTPILNDSANVVIASGGQVALNFTGNDVVGSLEIDGSGPLPPDTYNSGHPTYGSFFTGIGSLVVPSVNGTWASTVDGNWSDTFNWAGGNVATGYGATATFNAATGVAVTVDANRKIGNLAFDASDYTLAGSSNLTLESSGTPTISVGSGRTATISANLAGEAGMEKTGAGELLLTGVKTYTGGTTVSAGTLTLSGIAGGYGLIRGDVTVGSGATLSTISDGTGLGWRDGYKPTSVTINGGTISSTGGDHIAAIPGGVNMTGGTLETDATIQWINTALTTSASSDTATIAGGLNLRGDGGVTAMAVDVADGAAATDLLISANITELYGKLGITKFGMGTMTLSGINTYTGNTTINEGTVVLADDAQLTFAVTDTNQNLVGGVGTATFNGDFNINTSAVTGTNGGIWLLVDVVNLNPASSFEPTFNVIGFTQQGDGVTWTMTDAKGDWSFDESTGELTLDVGSDYDDWVTANGVAGGETADDDNDGLSNFDEYAFGLDPTGGSSVNPISSQLNKTTGQFTYQRRDNDLTGLTYTIWFSTDLANWNQDTGASQPDGTPDGNGVETINVSLSPLPGDPLPVKLFVQVRAN